MLLLLEPVMELQYLQILQTISTATCVKENIPILSANRTHLTSRYDRKIMVYKANLPVPVGAVVGAAVAGASDGTAVVPASIANNQHSNLCQTKHTSIVRKQNSSHVEA
jgi:hypothetical protein